MGLLKKITKPIKKALKSPLGKLAAAWAMYQYGPAMFGESSGGLRGLAGWKKGIAAKMPWLYTPGTEGVWAGVGSASGPGLGGTYTAAKPAAGILGKAATWMGKNKALTAAGLAMGAGALGDDVLEEKKTVIDTSGHEGYLNSRKMFVDEWTEWLIDQGHDPDEARAMAEKELFAKAEGGIVGLAQGGRATYGLGSWVKGLFGKKEASAEASADRPVGNISDDALRHKVLNIFKNKFSDDEDVQFAANGGRIRAQEGGLMDLGGQEKDYRENGGFVPLGEEERADDVPARLSKNEFVFTADAVRAAGGGDIDAGSEVMQNVMDNLEQGGEVSEDSQGLEGGEEIMSEEIIDKPNPAQGMLDNYEQLQSRVA